MSGNKEAAVGMVEPPEDLQIVGEAEVIKVIDGDTVRLSTGQEVRLVGIQAPKLSLGRKEVPDWPYGNQAREALLFDLINRNVRYGHAGNLMDRHGRGLAHLVRDDGNWVQGWMIANGHARVYSFPDNRLFVRRLQELEIAARAARRGLWAINLYAIRQATDTSIKPYSFFHLIEGQVQATGDARGWRYLNFGPDWKTDFTVAIKADDQRRFRDEWPDWETLVNRQVRVRGWVYYHNGPAIDVTHPEQIEVIG